MKEKTQTEDDFNSSNVLYVMYKWRKPLLIIGLTAIIISAVVALTIHDKYKSIVILFPASTSSISTPLLSEHNPKQEDILQFGEESAAEQMLQILNSDEIRARICQKYDLMTHYGINSDNKYKRTLMYDEFLNNVAFKRTEYMSVKIEVMDTDPVVSAAIANDIAALHDSVKINILRQRSMLALKIVEREYLSKLEQVARMTDSMKAINSKGLFDYESQTERTIQQYNIELSKGDQKAMKSLEDKLNVIAAYGSSYISLRDNLTLQTSQLNMLKIKYEELKVDAQQELPQKFVVSSAYPAEKKSYPVRWVIVLVSTIATLLITILTILLIESIQKWRPG